MPAWWDKRYGKNAICGITHSRLRPGKDSNGVAYVIKLPCQHAFYRSVLIKWIETSSSYSAPKCPMCRQEFVLNFMSP